MKNTFNHTIIYQGSLNQHLGIAGVYRPRLPYHEILHLTPEQTRLFRKATCGEDKRADVILNRLKWRTINELSGHIFGTLFPEAPLAKQFSSKYAATVDEPCNLSFKDLRIPKRQVVEELMNNNVLPKNFYEL